MISLLSFTKTKKIAFPTNTVSLNPIDQYWSSSIQHVRPRSSSIDMISAALTLAHTKHITQYTDSILYANYYTVTGSYLDKSSSLFEDIIFYNNYYTISGSYLDLSSSLFENIPVLDAISSSVSLTNSKFTSLYQDTILYDNYYTVTGSYYNLSSSIFENKPFIHLSSSYNISGSSQHETVYNYTLNIISQSTGYINTTGSFEQYLSSSIDIPTGSIDFKVNYIQVRKSSDVSALHTITASSPTVYTMSFQNFKENTSGTENTASITASLIDVHISSITDVTNAAYNSQTPWWKDEIGNDYHLINPLRSGSGDYNTMFYPKEYHVYMIGDTEFISGSWLNKTGSLPNAMFYTDYNTNRFFHGRIFLSASDGVRYNSYMDSTGSGEHTSMDSFRDGRMIGRTAFYRTGSGGNLIYPSNHYVMAPTSKPLILCYDGCKNGATFEDVNGDSFTYVPRGFGHNYDILPTASFYSFRVDSSDVDGESEGRLKVIN